MRWLAIVGLLCFSASAAAATSNGQAARGRYLVRIADCQTCHTAPGQAPFAGGRAVDTPFGTLYAPNITPDHDTGIGRWSFDDFYHALHDGIGPDGRDFYPAFPFPSYTLLTRDDVRAIWAYLRTRKPVHRRNRPPQLQWPYRLRKLMTVWRFRYFHPGPFRPQADKPAQWNRGAYLVNALGHCGSCHTARNQWGARQTTVPLAGGNVPVNGWIAPNITPNTASGIGNWSGDALRAFLHTGISERGDALGPMRDVVQSSLQYLNDDDLAAITAYLQAIPARSSTTGGVTMAEPHSAHSGGKALYHKHCAGCHGDDGRGKHGFYPTLAGNRVVLAADPNNLLLIILRGGFQAATEADPYPHSMPPFGFRLTNEEVAAVANYLRQSWGNKAPANAAPAAVDKLR